ncbi:hypothetical protein [Salinarimonas rosea]|uniref:hypothetical protein n=1 Tax=Salinarimonas rosea TaxID=552063 RepID=UPI0004015906|nr:hypothetical protein [Salinarimonas rosea]
MTGNRGQRREGKPRLTWPEAASAALGLAVLTSTLGVLGYDIVAGGRAPPAVSVRAEAVRETPDGYLVGIVARNGGDETGASVRVTGRLLREDGAVAETRATTFDYVPAGSERHGGLFFEADPRLFDLRLAADGYVAP